MTFEQCHTNLTAIRRRQGTPCPVVKVAYNGMIFQGRLARTDTDLESRRSSGSPYGVLVLENQGLVRSPETILQIAGIPEDGIVEANRDNSA